MGSSGDRAPVKAWDPVKPSQKEMDEHEVTHLPFRNWCRDCVHGRGEKMHHRVKARDEVDCLMKLNIDIMFLQERPFKCLLCTKRKLGCHRRRRRKEGACIFVGNWVRARRCDCQIRSRACGGIHCRGMWVGGRAVGGGGRWVCENSLVGSSASNGDEEGDRASAAEGWVLRLALEETWKMNVAHKTLGFALDHRVFGFPTEQVRGRPRWQNEEGDGA